MRFEKYGLSDDLEYLVPEPKEEKKVPRNLFEKVTEILYYHDLLGLAPVCPEDEYDIEAAFIVGQLRKVSDLRELRWMIHEVFCHCFSEDSAGIPSDVRYGYMADEIWEAWQDEIARLGLERSEEIFGR